MKRTRPITLSACLLGTLLLGAEAVSAQAMRAAVSAEALQPDAEGFVIAQPDDLFPPEGGTRTNVVGDPSQPGLYVIRITFAPGRGSRPHFHDQARLINVIKGTWWVSTGQASDVYDPDNMTRVEAGSFLYEPPNGHHYDMAKDEEVTVQIMGVGPVVTTQLTDGD